MSAIMQRFGAWSTQQGCSCQKHTAQGVLGISKRIAFVQVHSECNGGDGGDGGGSSCSCNPGDTNN